MGLGLPQDAPSGDLDTVEDIEEMVTRFYRVVAQDDLLGPMYNQVARVDWSVHVPKLASFWFQALLGIDGFEGNLSRAHERVNELSPYTPAHFERWLELFHETVEEGWVGPRADRALRLAEHVAEAQQRRLAAATAAAEPVLVA
ncbi:MAG: group III truncated hemoglobin [Acidimicrobiales bacterium]|nr:group III truncated hemoglobin [Acidimicrobiales bacterium]